MKRIILAILFLVFGNHLLAQSIIFVNQNSTNAVANGQQWSSAYHEVRDALSDPRISAASASQPVSIWIATGTYRPTSGSDQTVSFVLHSHLRLLGGFLGTEATAAQRMDQTTNIPVNPTVLSGDIGRLQTNTVTSDTPLTSLTQTVFQNTDPGFMDNSVHVLTGVGVTDVILDGLIITGGNASNTNLSQVAVQAMSQPLPGDELGQAQQDLDPSIAGGGLVFVNSPGMVTNSSPNYAAADLTILGCIFVNNSAQGFGGGLGVREARVSCQYSQFLQNFTDWEGGGFWGQNQLGTFFNCVFAGNAAFRSGGGVQLETLPSKRTTAPNVTDVQFETISGTPLTNLLNGIATVQAAASLAFDTVAETVLNETNGTGVTARDVRYEKDGFALATAIVARTPAVKPIASFVTGELGYAGSLLKGTAIVGTVATAFDLGVQISILAGVNPNSPFVKGWNLFFVNFNKYATPVGLLTLLFNEITYLWDLADIPPPYIEAATTLRQTDAEYYNDVPPSFFNFCQFNNNSSSGTGGGLMDTYDNVQVQSSSFTGNSAVANAGGAAITGYSTSSFASDSFLSNSCLGGCSAVLTVFHPRVKILNCTIVNNSTTSSNGFAIDNEVGSDVMIANSILWGNTSQSRACLSGGADLFTSTYALLDTNSQSIYTAAGNAPWQYVSRCDLRFSDVQSLHTLPVGGAIYWFQLPGLPTDPQGVVPPVIFTPTSQNGLSDQDLQVKQYLAEVRDILTNFVDLDFVGIADQNGYFNVGEGNRATFTNSFFGNICVNPSLVTGGIRTLPSAPVIGLGNPYLINYGFNILPGIYPDNYDIFGTLRLQNSGNPYLEAVDMGAAENYGEPVFSTLYVNTHVVGGNGNGLDWADALRSIPVNAYQLPAGTSIWVATGTYDLTGNPGEIYLDPGVSIYGGFAGGETDVSQSNPRLNPTIVTRSDPGELLTAPNGVGPTVIHGLTFKGLNEGNLGAGAMDITGPAIVEDCTFELNDCSEGVVVVEEGPITFNNCQFLQNSGGPSLYSYDGDIKLLNCLFSQNTGGDTANGLLEFHGLINGGSAEICGTEISSNTGGIRCDTNTTLLLQNCTIVSNVLQYVFGDDDLAGAGVSFPGTGASIINSVLYGNQVTGSGETLEQQQFYGAASVRSSDIQGLTTLANPATSGCFDVNPQFVNNGNNGDFQLAANSSLIDAGSSNVVKGLLETNDLSGNFRVVRQIDIGAYEFQGTPSVAAEVPVTEAQTCGGIPQFTLTVAQPPLLPPLTGYQWQINRLDGLGFVPLIDGAPYSGSRTLQLQITGPAATNNDYFYRLTSTNSPAFSTPVVEVATYNSILYVNQNATGAGNGTDWNDAFTDLTSALNVAHACSQIWVAAGTYSPGATTSYSPPASQVQIYGGFAGTETNLAQRNPLVNVTLLQNSVSPVLEFGFPPAAGFSTLVDSCEIQELTSSAFHSRQMAVDIQNEAVSFNNCRFVNGTALPISVDGGNLSVSHCVFSGNHDSFGVAGIENGGGGSAVIADSQFTGNDGASGGAIENYAGSLLSVFRCSFEENYGTNLAGGIQNNGTASVVSSLFEGNLSGGGGAALANTGSSLNIVNCTILNNDATLGGGGVYGLGTGLSIWNSILWNNSLQTQLPPTTESGQIDITYGSPATVHNSIVQGLSSYTGNGNILANPLFASAAGGDYRLARGSPAIDAGSVSASQLPVLDFNSNPLPYPGTLPDIGAFEYQGAAGTPVSLLSIPGLGSSCVNVPVQLSITGVPGSSNVYQWQEFNGTSFTNVISSSAVQIVQQGTTSTLVITNPASLSQAVFEVVVNDGAYTSDPIVITNEAPTIIYVDANRQYPNNPVDGSLWVNAFPTIQQALAVAGPCSQIWVAEGTYTGTVMPVSGIGIYGGFSGQEGSLDERDIAQFATRLVADPASFTSLTLSSRGSPAADSSAVIDGFYISGSADRAALISHSSPTLQNCIIESNSTGIWVDAGGSPTFNHCTFRNNTDTALYLNLAQNPQILDCLFTNNTMFVNGESGAAIQALQSTFHIADSRFLHNVGNIDPVVYANESSTLFVERCIFAGNSAISDASALGVYNSTLTLDNSLFTDNTNAVSGAPIDARLSQLTLINDTISGNFSPDVSAGLSQFDGSLTIQNCILWHNFGSTTNTTVEQNQLQVSGVSPAISHTIIDGLSEWQNALGNNLAYDPIFAGPTNGDFELSSNSPAIAAGSGAGLETNSLDLADEARFDGTNIDLGAYEFSGVAGTPSYLHDDLSSRTICAGSGTSFSVVFNTANAFSVQWQVFDGTNWGNVATNEPGLSVTNMATGSTLMISTADLSLNGTEFRYLLQGAGGYISQASTIYVYPRDIAYVDSLAIGNGDGSSWTNAFTSLSQAFSAAGNCSAVWVAGGIYPQSQSLTPPPGVEVDGGFPRGGQWTDRNLVLYPTVITAASPAFTNELMKLEQPDPTGERTVVDGIDFTNATLGVSVIQRSPAFRNCRFENIAGDAVASSDGNLLVTNCVFAENVGSAILDAGYSTLMVESSIFSGNQNSAIDAVASQVSVRNSQFTGNSSAYYGGALEVFYSAATVTSCGFSNNTANSGGAIDVEPASSLVLRDCLLAGNTADFTGGAIENSGTLAVINCTVADNLAQYEGGGLAQYQGTCALDNSIFWGNNSESTEVTNSESANLYLQSASGGLITPANDLIQFQQTVVGPQVTGVNPLFSNPAAGDFTVSSNSPAVNAGNNSFVISGDTDAGGAARIQQGTVDLGAYESSASGAGELYILSLPHSATVYTGFSTNFSVATTHEYAFQWEYSFGGGWTNLSDGDVLEGTGIAITGGVGTNSILTIGNSSVALNGLQIRVLLAGESFASPAATLTVLPVQTIYVDASVATNGDGTSWATAYKTLSVAINAELPYRNTIYVAQGTYAGGTTIFQPTVLYGGFPTGGSALAARNARVYPTIVAGGSLNDASVVDFDGSESFITNTSMLDGFTIQGGAPGLNVFKASPTLRNLIVRGNNESGLYVEGAPQLQNCVFENNTNDQGGGAYIDGNPVFLDCVFQGNVANDPEFAIGGGILVIAGNPQFLNVLISGNHAGTGGALWSEAPFLMVNSTVAGNYADSTGGGIYSSYGTGTIINSILWQNRDPLHSTEEAQAVAAGGGTLQFSYTSIESLATFSGPGVVSEDPLFVGSLDGSPIPTTNGDFHLAPCSPLISGGSAAAAVNIDGDLEGNPLTMGTVGLGAYQFTGTSATPLLITAQPADQVYSSAGGNHFSVAAIGDALTYEWQIAPPGGSFSSLVGSSDFNGATGVTLTLSQADASMNGSLLRCQVTSSEGCVAYSREAVLTVYASRYYVNVAQPDDSGNGLSWSTAFKTLTRAALAPVNPGGTAIWVAEGTYQPFKFANGDLFYGGFSGTETSLNQRNWVTNPTIVEGSANFNPAAASNPYNSVIIDCFTNYVAVPGTTSATNYPITLGRVDGFVLRNGSTAIDAQDGTTGFTIANCAITNCYLGVWSVAGATVQIDDCRFENSASGFADDSGSSTVSNSVFTGNGTGIELDDASLAVANCRFFGNGSGIYASSDRSEASLTANDSIFSGNTLGLQLTGEIPLSFSAQRCTFSGNGTNNGFFGGAVEIDAQVWQAAFADCLFSGNCAARGGAVYNNGYATVFQNCTFAGNRNTALYNDDEASGSVVVYNSILWGNSDVAADAPYWWLTAYYGPYTNSPNSQLFSLGGNDSGNIIEDENGSGHPAPNGFMGNGSVSLDPGFVQPVDPATAPTTNGDFHLTPCSAVLALGNAGHVGSSLADLDGQARLFGGTVTPGAYEPQSAPLNFVFQPTNAVGILNENITFAAGVGNSAGVTYNWQGSIQGGAYADLANAALYTGATTTQLGFVAGTNQNGESFRLRASYPSGCSIYSAAATFTLYAPVVSAAGPGASGILGLPATGFGFNLAGGINPATLNDQSVMVYGMESGRLRFGDGSLAFTISGSSVTLNPARPLHPGEVVFVTVNSSLQSANGFSVAPRTWQFVNDVTSGDGAFNNAQTVSLPGNPTANLVQAGDLNGDGSIDLFVSTTTGCRVLTNNCAGAFSDSGQLMGSDAATKIILGNLRGRGLLDAVLLRDGAVEVWTNSDAGLFALAGSYSGAAVTDCALGDLNNDGLMDLFILTPTNNEVWWNNGAGNFSNPGTVLSSANSVAVALGDFNGDGNLDAYVVHSDGTPGQLWLNQAGTFVAGTGAGLPGAAAGYERLISANVLGDGQLDLVAVTNGVVQVWRGGGDGSFSLYYQTAAANPHTISIGDINGDRRGDMIVGTGGGTLTPYVGKAGGFQTLYHQGSFATATATTLADLNGDGAQDLAMVSPAGQLEIALYEPVQLYGTENTYAYGNTTDALPIWQSSLEQQFETRFADGLNAVLIKDVPTNGFLMIGNDIISPGDTIDYEELFFVEQNVGEIQYVGFTGSYGADSFTWQGVDAGYIPGQAVPPPEPYVFKFNISIAPIITVTAQNDFATVNQGQSVSALTGGAVSVLANDQDQNGDGLTAALTVPPAHGAVQLNPDGTFTYAHDGSETHADSFSYRATDTSGKSGTATVFITINNVNNTPTAINLAQNLVYEGQPPGLVAGVLSSIDPDPQAGGYVYALVAGAGDTDNAFFVISTNEVVTATTLSCAAGSSRSIRVRTTDSQGAYYEQALTVNLTPLPVANPLTMHWSENGPALYFQLTGSASRSLQYVLLTSPSHGTLNGTVPTLSYTPNHQFAGADSFTFQTTDGLMTSSVATVTIIMDAIDEAPLVQGTNLVTTENTALNLTLEATPYIAGDPVQFTIVTPPHAGTLSGTSPNFIYLPATNHFGSDWFAFNAADTALNQTSAVVIAQITVNPSDTPPLAYAETVQGTQNDQVVFQINALDINSSVMTYTVVTPPQHGILSSGFLATPQSIGPILVSYLPTNSFTGTDSFAFIVSNGRTNSAPATVTINVTPPELPVADAQTVVTTAGQPVNITLTGSDPLGQTLYFQLAGGAGRGTVTGTPPNVTYTPLTTNYYGTDTFKFATLAGNRESALATVSVTVQRTYQPPVAVSALYTNYGGEVQIQLQASDPQGLPLTYQIVSGPTNGILLATNFPLISYAPNTNFYGRDSFIFTVSNGQLTSTVAAIEFDVIEPVHPPTVPPYGTNAFVGIPVTINVLALSSDAANDPLTLLSVIPGSGDTVTISNNLAIYTLTNSPSSGISSDDSFGYVVSNHFETATGYVYVTPMSRDLVVGLQTSSATGTPVFVTSGYLDSFDSLPDAVSFANSFGPSLEWTINMTGPAELVTAQTNTADGGLSALGITGNIRIVPIPLAYEQGAQITNFALSGVASESPLRMFQVAPGARLRLENCVISGGSARQGGAIFNAGTVELWGTTLTGNFATNGGGTGLGEGGAIFNYNGWIAMTNSLLTNNVADVAGGVYQVGDGAAAFMTVDNVLMTSNASPQDFLSSVTNGGTSTITATLLQVDHPSMPWFGPLAASYAVPQDFAVSFPILADPVEFPFSVITASNDLPGLQVTGRGGAQRTLSVALPPGTMAGPEAVSVTASNGALSFVENFVLTVDPTAQNAPLAVSDYAVCPPSGGVLIPVLANDQNVDGSGQLSIVSAQDGQFGQVQVRGNQIYYSNTVPITFPTPAADSFTYEISNGYLTSTGTVSLVVVSLTQTVYFNDDNGEYGTLRATLEYVNQYYSDAGWHVVFATNQFSYQPADFDLISVGDSTLGGSALAIMQNITIDGSMLENAVIRCDPTAPPMRVFHVASAGNLTLINFTVNGGVAAADDFVGGTGGGILNEGSLSISNCVVDDNSALGTTNAPGEGGGIFNSGTFRAENSAITNNTALAGGGLFQLGDGGTVTATLVNCLVANPASGHDTVSSVIHGGLATILANQTTIANPQAPSVGAVNNQFITGSATIPVYLIATNFDDAQVSVQSDNTNVAPAAGLTLTGTGNLRQLGLAPVDNGIAHVTVLLSENGIGFGRSFAVGTVSGTPVNPLTPDSYFTLFPGQAGLLPVLANDVDPGGAPLTLLSVSSATAGTTIISNNEVFYVNAGSSVTNDFFTYVVTNGFGGSSTGRVFITTTLAEITVRNLYQTSQGSLADALKTANTTVLNGGVAWTILIDPSLAGQTLTPNYFTLGESSDYTAFVITNHIRIDGSQAPGFTLAANDNEYAGPEMRHFRISGTGDLELFNLTLSGGMAFSYGDADTLAEGNRAGLGGSIFNEGTLCVSNVTFANNTALGGDSGFLYPGLGGAIFNNGGRVRIVGSLFSENVAEGDSTGGNVASNLTGAFGGAIFNYNGSLTLISNVFAFNSANQAANVASVGDGNRAELFLRENDMTNSVPALDLVGEAINGGFSGITSYETNLMMQGTPAISAIGDQIVSNSVTVPFDFEYSSTNPVLTVSSSDPSVIANTGLAIVTNGNAGVLTITPGDVAGTTEITVELTDGALSYAEIFNVTVVALSAPTNAIVSSKNPSGFKDDVSFSVNEPVLATGTVVFFANNLPFSTNTVDNGLATSEVTAILPRGSNIITAAYAGDITYSGDTNMLVQIVTNHPPVATIYTVSRTPGLSLHVFWASVATNWSDADGDPITLAGVDLVSTNGVNLRTNSTQLLYTNGPVANDQIRYTISDGMGGANIGLVDVLVASPFIAGAQAPASVSLHDGAITVVFYGIPSYVYEVQRSTNLTIGPGWTTISTETVGPNGLINVTDLFPDLGGAVPAAAYYRLGWQP